MRTLSLILSMACTLVATSCNHPYRSDDQKRIWETFKKQNPNSHIFIIEKVELHGTCSHHLYYVKDSEDYCYLVEVREKDVSIQTIGTN